jgi:hypothetical protein
VLTLFDGATAVASLSISGNYYQKIFALSGDSAGGTDITLATPVPPTLSAPQSETFVVNSVNVISGVSVADPGAIAAGETITVSIVGSYGKLSASTPGGGVVTRDGGHGVTITGTLTEVDADLATLTYTAPSKPSSDPLSISASNSENQYVNGKIAVTIVNAAADPAKPAPSPAVALFTQAIAAFGAESAAILDRRDTLAAAPLHLAIAAAQH